MKDQYRLGVDIGGTFTDAILLNEVNGRGGDRESPVHAERPFDRFS